MPGNQGTRRRPVSMTSRARFVQRLVGGSLQGIQQQIRKLGIQSRDYALKNSVPLKVADAILLGIDLEVAQTAARAEESR